MAVRLRTRWHRSDRSERNRTGAGKPKTLDSLSSAVAINIWKLAKDSFLHMEKEGFSFLQDSQAIDVIAEFSIYSLHIIDRLIYEKLPEEERGPLINGIAGQLLETLVSNKTDLLGPGDYRGDLIDRFNERLGNYAECRFDEGDPGYDFNRYLGQQVAVVMASGDNQWVVEQVMDIEAPEMAEKIRPAVRDVLGVRDL
ncbi:MAG TPA: hypothetical protein ENI94_15220 [Gammaproteobacteria bacterium]|nr:hypothetical protein [Gammaproteobacteria bacterium]